MKFYDDLVGRSSRSADAGSERSATPPCCPRGHAPPRSRDRDRAVNKTRLIYEFDGDQVRRRRCTHSHDEAIAAAEAASMPRRDDIQKILVLGSGPIVIGQAAEFDYSGAQACKVLLEEGYEVVLVNSNPATIMTDPEFATATYIEPLLPGVGGARDRAGAARRAAADARRRHRAQPRARACPRTARSERYGVELIGADYDAIRRAEDRELFRETMERAGLRVPRSRRRSRAMAEARARAAGDRAAGDRPARLHDGRRGRRHRPQRGRVPPARGRGPRAPARSARCWSRSR